jgi:hypothetical protein
LLAHTAGFYDPRHKTMFMANWVDPAAQKLVLSHELTHALQDQSFDLWKFMRATRDDGQFGPRGAGGRLCHGSHDAGDVGIDPDRESAFARC